MVFPYPVNLTYMCYSTQSGTCSEPVTLQDFIVKWNRADARAFRLGVQRQAQELLTQTANWSVQLERGSLSLGCFLSYNY
jgi:hypothetical protein